MFRVIVLILLLIIAAPAKELQKVSLQLQWLDQFQFAGYYIAKEKGFYKDVGLDVEIQKVNNKVMLVDEVISKRITYAIGRSSLIFEKANGKDIVLLASIFQSSPSVLIARKDSALKSVKDFVGKKIMVTSDVYNSSSIRAMKTYHHL